MESIVGAYVNYNLVRVALQPTSTVLDLLTHILDQYAQTMDTTLWAYRTL